MRGKKEKGGGGENEAPCNKNHVNDPPRVPGLRLCEPLKPCLCPPWSEGRDPDTAAWLPGTRPSAAFAKIPARGKVKGTPGGRGGPVHRWDQIRGGAWTGCPGRGGGLASGCTKALSLIQYREGRVGYSSSWSARAPVASLSGVGTPERPVWIPGVCPCWGLFRV